MQLHESMRSRGRKCFCFGQAVVITGIVHTHIYIYIGGTYIIIILLYVF